MISILLSHLATLRHGLLAIYAQIGYAEPVPPEGGCPAESPRGTGVGGIPANYQHPTMFSHSRFRFSFRSTMSSRHRRRTAAITESPLGTCGTALRAGPCIRNCTNSVGHFTAFAAKLTLHGSSLLRQGCPLDPSEPLEKFGAHGCTAQIFSSCSDQRAPLWTPPAPPKTPGTQPWIFH